MALVRERPIDVLFPWLWEKNGVFRVDNAHPCRAYPLHAETAKLVLSADDIERIVGTAHFHPSAGAGTVIAESWDAFRELSRTWFDALFGDAPGEATSVVPVRVMLRKPSGQETRLFDLHQLSDFDDADFAALEPADKTFPFRDDYVPLFFETETAVREFEAGRMLTEHFASRPHTAEMLHYMRGFGLHDALVRRFAPLRGFDVLATRNVLGVSETGSDSSGYTALLAASYGEEGVHVKIVDSAQRNAVYAVASSAAPGGGVTISSARDGALVVLDVGAQVRAHMLVATHHRGSTVEPDIERSRWFASESEFFVLHRDDAAVLQFPVGSAGRTFGQHSAHVLGTRISNSVAIRQPGDVTVVMVPSLAAEVAEKHAKSLAVVRALLFRLEGPTPLPIPSAL